MMVGVDLNNFVCIANFEKTAYEEQVVDKNLQKETLEEEEEQDLDPALFLTEEERELLARLVYQEGNIESLECQIAIASVVINRVNAGIFGGDNIYDVIYAKGQFSTAYMLDETVPNDINYEAVDYVIQNGPSIPYYVCFFRANYYFKEYTPYCNIDHTYFSYRQSHVELLKGE